MSNDKLTLDYSKIPVLAVGFARGSDFFGGIIRWVTGGVKAIGDKSFPNHAFLVTDDHGQLFATEETAQGLVERSLEEYTTSGNRIVAMYRWRGWDEGTREHDAMNELATIRRKAKEDSKYDFWGLAKFLPIIGKYVKPDPKKQWCSENCASIMRKYGASFIETCEIDPNTLFREMQCSPECQEIYSYYLPAQPDEVIQALIAKPQDTKLIAKG